MPLNETKLLQQFYGDAEGPLGFKMRSDDAKELETLIKGLPEDCRKAGLKHAVFIPDEITKGTDAANDRTDISLITTDAIDRDREVMYPEGGNFKQFLKNPVVTWAHKYDMMPVGKCLWMKRTDPGGSKNGWAGKTRYSDAPVGWKGDWFPDAVWSMISAGNLRGKSIGFIPLEMRSPTAKEIEARPELSKMPLLIPKWVALEYAVAPVQCNPDAVVEAVGKCRQKGVKFPDRCLADMGIAIPEEVQPLDLKALGIVDGDEEPPVVPFKTVEQKIQEQMKTMNAEAILRKVFAQTAR